MLLVGEVEPWEIKAAASGWHSSAVPGHSSAYPPVLQTHLCTGARNQAGEVSGFCYMSTEMEPLLALHS